MPEATDIAACQEILIQKLIYIALFTVTVTSLSSNTFIEQLSVRGLACAADTSGNPLVIFKTQTFHESCREVLKLELPGKDTEANALFFYRSQHYVSESTAAALQL